MKRRARKTGGIPVLKLPPGRIWPTVTALRSHEYDREGFRIAVMALFADNKVEKSVFRGMAIPTLRALGLLQGFESELHLSADGALVAASADTESTLPMAILLREIENELELVAPWRGGAKKFAAVLDELCRLDSEGGVTSETKRRAQRWLSYLEHFGVILKTHEAYRRQSFSVQAAISESVFASVLLASYRSLSPKTVGEPAVSIDEVARASVLDFFHRGQIITRRLFDQLLTRCMSRGDLAVHLHRSMGAGQRLFVWGGDSYEAISIRRGSYV